MENVLLLGATGETGNSILNGLLETKKFRVVCLVRPSSAGKPAAKRLTSLENVEVRLGSGDDSVEKLKTLLDGIDTVISAIGPEAQASQENLATAAKEVGTVKRFVPCGFITVAPVGGIMLLRDEKELVNNHIRRLYLPYTFVDCGYWYEISFPRLPSGKADYVAILPNDQLRGNPDAKNMLTALPDVGRYLARIIADPGTLNKSVSIWGESLYQNEVVKIMEDVSGEDVTSTMKTVTADELKLQVEVAKGALANASEEDKKGRVGRMALWGAQYNYGKYVREDNTPEHAAYLGYLDVHELYPDFKPQTFKEFAQELVKGNVRRPYPGFKL